MLVLILVTMVCDVNVFIGCIASILVTTVIIFLRKRSSLPDYFKASYEGINSMLFVYLELIGAFTLVEINTRLGVSDFVVQSVTPYLSGSIVPMMIFLVCGIYGYFGGGCWDMSMIFFPIVMPIAFAVGANPIIAGAAVVAASTVCSTNFICSDAVLIVSKTCGIKPNYYGVAVLPYTLISFVISCLGFLSSAACYKKGGTL